MSVNGIGTAGYPAWHETRRADSGKKADFEEKVKAAGTTNIVNIDPDALFSIHHVKTGESANVYRAEDYSEDNPVYLVKGIDKNGNKYEQTVDVGKVNPNNCSYTEILALNAHTGKKSDSNFMIMSILKDKSDSISYHEKADYLSMAYGLMRDMKTLENWDGYLRYDKWINDILNFCKNRAGQSCQQEQTAGQESETNSEIIVKPDGSKVLVMKISVGGMETDMSLEISKPTKAPNENSKQDINNSIPTAKNDTVSDEVSDVSSQV